MGEGRYKYELERVGFTGRGGFENCCEMAWDGLK